MALGNLRKRKPVLSASTKSKSTARRVNIISAVISKKGKSASTDPKKRQLTGGPLVSKRKRSRILEGRICIMFSKLIDTGTVADHEVVFYLRKRDQFVMKEGKVTRDGVVCCCCSRLFGLTKFEVHAGSTLHRPSANMFLRDGRSIMECLHSADQRGNFLYAQKMRQPAPFACDSQPDDGNDNTCQVCGDGGQLILCDSCPSSFHYDCLHLDSVPDGDWHCSRCKCGSCGKGRIDDKGELGSSMTCCSQCQVPYHQRCILRAQTELKGNWYCSKVCRYAYQKLQKLIGSVFAIDKDLSWMLLKASCVEHDALNAEASGGRLAEALTLLQQCFDPIIDQESGIDMFSQLVYSRKSHVRRLDCSAFYTMLLMKGNHVVSVAIVRTHGRTIAEVPFIATEWGFRQQGMCKALMQTLELTLREIGVCKLVLPSINEVVDTWTGSFGFRSVSLQDRKQLVGTSFLLFPGATLLAKSLVATMTRSRSEPFVEASTVHQISVIQGMEQIPKSKKASLSHSQPVSCH